MTATTIVLPRRLEASGHAWQPCVEAAARIRSDAAATTLDAGSVVFAQPFGLVLVGSALIQRAALGLPPLRFVAPSSREVREFLDEIAFANFVSTPASELAPLTPLSIRRLSSTSLDPTFAKSVAQTLERLVPGTSESVAYNVELSLNELLQNVMEHAASPLDCVVHARWYAKQENLRLAVADAGVGLAASLGRNPKFARVTDDRRLVTQALTVPGVTARTSGRFGGFGLKSLRDFVVKRGGEVSVASGVVFARVGSGGVHADFAPRLHGTTIEPDFRPLPDDGSRGPSGGEEFF